MSEALSESLLERAIEQLGVDVSQPSLDGLLQYLGLLRHWNRAFNLVSSASAEDALSRHVLDSLTVLPHVLGGRLLDVGTGAGLPGLVLAIARPALSCTLLDSSLKRIRFCRQAAAELGLTNVEPVRSQIEHFAPPARFSTLVSRAFTATGGLVTYARHLCESEGRVISMKGARSQVEVDALAAMPENSRWVEVSVPGLEAKRHLVVVDLAATRAG